MVIAAGATAAVAALVTEGGSAETGLAATATPSNDVEASRRANERHKDIGPTIQAGRPDAKNPLDSRAGCPPDPWVTKPRRR